MHIDELIGEENTDIIIDGKVVYQSVAVNNTSEVTISLDQYTGSFQTGVMLSDGADDSVSVDFFVYADNRLLDSVVNVRKKDNITYINVNLDKVDRLVLKTSSKYKDDHQAAVWIKPKIFSECNKSVKCPINNIEARLPDEPIMASKCIFTVLTNGFERYYKNMVKTLHQYGEYKNTALVVLGFNLNQDAKNIVFESGAYLVDCSALGKIHNTSCKTIAFSIPYLVSANKYLYLDTDTLICSDLNHLFDILDSVEPGAVLAVRHGDKNSQNTFRQALLNKDNYDSNEDELTNLNLSAEELLCNKVINSGFWVASAHALTSVYHCIETFMPQLKAWVEQKTEYDVREEAVLIAALARLRSCVLLDESYNMQMHFYCPQLLDQIHKVEDVIYYGDKMINILHFTGSTKPYYYSNMLSLLDKI